MTLEDPNFVQRSLSYQNLFLSKGYTTEQAGALSTMMINKAATVQAQLLTCKTIFIIGSLLTGFAIIVLFAFIVVNKIIAFRNQAQQRVVV